MLLSREAIADAIEIVTADDLYKPVTRKCLMRSHHCLQRGSRLYRNGS